MADRVNILPPNALENVDIGVSISESPDLSRLGLLESHLRLALGDIARSVLVQGGNLVYGGNLSAEGYTAALLEEVQRYGRTDRPLKIILAWPVHRAMALSVIVADRRRFGLHASVAYLDPNGHEIDPSQHREEAPESFTDRELLAESFTSLRAYMTERVQARILVGGRRQGFLGKMPGVLEEALMSVESALPLFLAGGFGGVTLDVLRTLDSKSAEWFPAEAGQADADPSLIIGLEQIAQIGRSGTWPGFNNGLSDEENSLLAATYRPSEIATLLTLGLGRRFANAASNGPGSGI